MLSRGTRGFSLVELMIVSALILVVTAFSIMAIQPSLKQNDVSNAYNQTLMALRQARETSVAQRQIYFVTLNNVVLPNTITITQGSTGTVTSTYSLPANVAFVAVGGIPVSQGAFPTTPDGFGVGGAAIDFDQGIVGGVKNVIYFYPDGSAQDAVGNINNGVVYVAMPGFVNTSRAITLWGTTGRLRGWRLSRNAGIYYWRQQ